MSKLKSECKAQATIFANKNHKIRIRQLAKTMERFQWIKSLTNNRNLMIILIQLGQKDLLDRSRSRERSIS